MGVWSESLWGLRKTVQATNVEEAIEQWWPTARQKRLYLHHQWEFQHNYDTFMSLQDSDHDGVVRIFVGHSEVVKRLLLITSRGNHTPGSCRNPGFDSL